MAGVVSVQAFAQPVRANPAGGVCIRGSAQCNPLSAWYYWTSGNRASNALQTRAT